MSKSSDSRGSFRPGTSPAMLPPVPAPSRDAREAERRGPALSRVPLSVAYPFNALGYLGILTASVVVLHERANIFTWLGSVLVVSGLVVSGLVVSGLVVSGLVVSGLVIVVLSRA